MSTATPELFSKDDLQRDHMRRRRIVNRTMEGLAILAAFAAVGMLVILVWSVARRGASALDLNFLTKIPIPFSFTNEPSGIANAIVGSAILVAIATMMALPVGVLTAVFLTEFAPKRVANAITLTLDVLNGVPAVVIGIFVFALVVIGRGQSGFAGSFALAILMLPMIARATQEVLLLVPQTHREAALALGATKSRTTLRVVLPMTIGGIVTGSTLAVARVAGETAPLLFTSSLAGTALETDPKSALASIPVTIFQYSESPDPADQARAWAAALVLILFVLLSGIAARSLAARSRARLAGRR